MPLSLVLQQIPTESQRPRSVKRSRFFALPPDAGFLAPMSTQKVEFSRWPKTLACKSLAPVLSAHATLKGRVLFPALFCGWLHRLSDKHHSPAFLQQVTIRRHGLPPLISSRMSRSSRSESQPYLDQAHPSADPIQSPAQDPHPIPGRCQPQPTQDPRQGKFRQLWSPGCTATCHGCITAVCLHCPDWTGEPIASGWGVILSDRKPEKVEFLLEGAADAARTIRGFLAAPSVYVWSRFA